jgi:hypothetical protein
VSSTRTSSLTSKGTSSSPVRGNFLRVIGNADPKLESNVAILTGKGTQAGRAAIIRPDKRRLAGLSFELGQPPAQGALLLPALGDVA